MSDSLMLGIVATVIVLLTVTLGVRRLYRIKGGKKSDRYEEYADHERQIATGGY